MQRGVVGLLPLDFFLPHSLVRSLQMNALVSIFGTAREAEIEQGVLFGRPFQGSGEHTGVCYSAAIGIFPPFWRMGRGNINRLILGMGGKQMAGRGLVARRGKRRGRKEETETQ